MSLKHGLLGLLNYQPMTGYELDKEFSRTLGHFWQASGSQIYFELDAMESKGWLESERIMQEERPNKRVYSITPEGKTELVKWLSMPPSNKKQSSRQRSTLLMRVFFGGEVDKRITLELLRAFRNECLDAIGRMEGIDEELARYEQEQGPDAIRYWKLTAECGEIMIKARLEWAEKAIATLE